MLGQILFNGIAAGFIYILAGLSFGIIFTTTGVFHFAHVSVYTIGGLWFYQMAVIWNQPFILSLVSAIVLASCLGVLIEWICYRPLQDLQATPLQIFLTAVGVMTVLQNVAQLIWKTDPQVVPISQELLKGRVVGGIWITYFKLITLATVLGIWGILHLFIVKSKTGKAIRAFAADPKTLELMGVDPRGLRLIIYFIGSALIALTADLQIIEFGMDITTGLGVVLLGVIATLIGAGWGLTGIAFASLALGIIENIGMVILSNQWKYIILFGIITLLLIIRPKAIFRNTAR